jgi:NADH:ubiquinone oxidoreductase subunit 5 (subunit L)/multisubunit Na+/H+ antiporter MnhA subunit
MTVPLVVLAAASAVGGLVLGFPHLFAEVIHVHIPHVLDKWLHPIFVEVDGVQPGIFPLTAGPEVGVMVTSTVLALAGWFVAKKLYVAKGLASDEKFHANMPWLSRNLENKWYVDELYGATVIGPLHRFSTICWKVFDAIIDGLISLGAYVIAAFGDIIRFFQTGNVRNYALMMFVGIVVFIWVYV